MTRISSLFRTLSCGKQNRFVTYYLAIIMFMQSGDLHPNPGPYKPKYPCVVCQKATKWGQRAVCCDECDVWYHIDCMDMTTEIIIAANC